ncbi:hypothetical protein [Pararhizobium sp. LjRoot238]
MPIVSSLRFAARITAPTTILTDGDPVKDWFERSLDLRDGLGRSVTAA